MRGTVDPLTRVEKLGDLVTWIHPERALADAPREAIVVTLALTSQRSVSRREIRTPSFRFGRGSNPSPGQSFI
ncbi:Protein kinase domain-containing protein [Psidium guajava]|nr:Protein kinase domain-containing protein [Psidium guajava]